MSLNKFFLHLVELQPSLFPFFMSIYSYHKRFLLHKTLMAHEWPSSYNKETHSRQHATMLALLGQG